MPRGRPDGAGGRRAADLVAASKQRVCAAKGIAIALV
jgi:hypothetical protein